MHSLLPSLPVVTLARESSGGTIHPSLPQSKDSSLLLDEYIKLHNSPRSRFPSSHQNNSSPNLLQGASLGSKSLIYIQHSPSSTFLTLIFLSCFTTSSHFLLSLFCLTELLYVPPVIFSANLSPQSRVGLSSSSLLACLPFTPDQSFLGPPHLHPSCSDHKGLHSSSSRAPPSATKTYCVLSDSERSFICDSSQKNPVDFHPISKSLPFCSTTEMSASGNKTTVYFQN